MLKALTAVLALLACGVVASVVTIPTGEREVYGPSGELQATVTGPSIVVPKGSIPIAFDRWEIYTPSGTLLMEGAGVVFVVEKETTY